MDISNPAPLHVLEQAAEWKAQGSGVALATVVRTWGSAPRQAGSQMCIKAVSGNGGSLREEGQSRLTRLGTPGTLG